MNIFEKIQKKRLDVIIDIIPKLEGTKDDFSKCVIEVPHLGKSIVVEVPNTIMVGQMITKCGLGKKDKTGETGDLILKVIDIESYDIEISTKAVLSGPESAVSVVNVFIPHTSNTIALNVPNNTKEGTVFRLRDRGLHNANGNRGTLYIRIDKIVRYDIDISIKVDLVGPEDAKTVHTVEIPHLKKVVEVAIPNDIEIGQTIRLKGLGWEDGAGNKGDVYLKIEDIIDDNNRKSDMGDGYDRLNSLIGLESIKEEVNGMIDFVRIQIKRKEQGLKSVPMSLHCVFSGNPGTGKTTIARILADVYKEIGVLSKGQLVEVDRSDLVSQYIGETAIKTQEKIKEAIGGILFIDEAYTLIKEDSPRDFGQEAIDTLLKAMEDYRDEFIVIVAGYDELMKKFINSNPGLKSRFSRVIHFPDYSSEEMYQIFRLMCREYQYRMTPEAKKVLKFKLEQLESNKEPNFANAREVRNLFEKVIRNQAIRLSNSPSNDMMKIIEQDILLIGEN